VYKGYSHWTDWLVGDFNENPLVEIKFGYNVTQISGSSHENLSTFIVADVITGVLISP